MSLNSCSVNVETPQGCADGAKCYAAQDSMLWRTSEIDERAAADLYNYICSLLRTGCQELPQGTYHTFVFVIFVQC
jgi:hypothetical protein